MLVLIGGIRLVLLFSFELLALHVHVRVHVRLRFAGASVLCLHCWVSVLSNWLPHVHPLDLHVNHRGIQVN